MIGPITPAPAEKTDPRLHQVAAQFEALFLQQVLEHAKLGKGEGYTALATQALADGLAKDGGIGLARALEDSIARTLSHQKT